MRAATPATQLVSKLPSRIVSLDYCADQYLVGLVERTRILRVSPDATASYSWVRERAAGLRSVKPRAEDVLILRPDLVVRSYGGGPKAGAFLAEAGIPVVQVPYVSDIQGAQDVLLTMADALGAPDRGRALLEDMRKRLAAVRGRSSDGTVRDVLYIPPSGVSPGPGTLIDEIIRTAGLENFQQRPGWHPLPLERLAYQRPQLLALAFFGVQDATLDAWSPTSHPVAQRQIRELPAVRLDSSWVSCGGWFLIEAIEAMASAVPVPGAGT